MALIVTSCIALSGEHGRPAFTRVLVSSTNGICCPSLPPSLPHFPRPPSASLLPKRRHTIDPAYNGGGEILAIAFFPRREGRILDITTGCSKGFLTVYEIEGSKKIRNVRQTLCIESAHGLDKYGNTTGGSRAVHSVAAGVNSADDKRYLVSGGGDCTTRVWEVPESVPAEDAGSGSSRRLKSKGSSRNMGSSRSLETRDADEAEEKDSKAKKKLQKAMKKVKMINALGGGGDKSKVQASFMVGLTDMAQKEDSKAKKKLQKAVKKMKVINAFKGSPECKAPRRKSLAVGV